MADKKSSFGGTIRFKALMEKVNFHLAKLSDLVIVMISEGKRALTKDDEGLFHDIKIELEEVHEICYALEDAILNSIALHQPFAQDLRYILSTLKITNEIHRSAHDAVHIANSSAFIDLKIHSDMVTRIGKLASKASKMFKASIEAFRNRKAPSVEEWKVLDDEVDDLHVEIIDEMVSLMEKDTTWARAGVSLILATRYIERIADHACNIVEESIYVVTSKRVKIE
ncbi:MAG: phosphate signaling complex PhoU family protein [Candidatus Heimdallarchaeota archaeon]